MLDCLCRLKDQTFLTKLTIKSKSMCTEWFVSQVSITAAIDPLQRSSQEFKSFSYSLHLEDFWNHMVCMHALCDPLL